MEYAFNIDENSDTDDAEEVLRDSSSSNTGSETSNSTSSSSNDSLGDKSDFALERIQLLNSETLPSLETDISNLALVEEQLGKTLSIDIHGPTISSTKGGTAHLDYALFQLSDTISRKIQLTLVAQALSNINTKRAPAGKGSPTHCLQRSRWQTFSDTIFYTSRPRLITTRALDCYRG